MDEQLGGAAATPVTLAFLGLDVAMAAPDITTGPCAWAGMPVRLHFAAPALTDEVTDAVTDAVTDRLAVARVRRLQLLGIAPQRLWRVVLASGGRERLRFDSFSGRSGCLVSAGEMLAAMGRLEGVAGLSLDTSGAGLGWPGLRVSLEADLQGQPVAAIQVRALLARPAHPVERAGAAERATASPFQRLAGLRGATRAPSAKAAGG